MWEAPGGQFGEEERWNQLAPSLARWGHRDQGQRHNHPIIRVLHIQTHVQTVLGNVLVNAWLSPVTHDPVGFSHLAHEYFFVLN